MRHKKIQVKLLLVPIHRFVFLNAFFSKKSNSFSRKWIDWLEKPFPCVEVVPKKNFFLTIFHKKCETLKFEMSVNSGKERCLDFHNGSAKSKTGDVTAGHIDIFSDCYSSRGSAADGLSGPEENGLENISFGLIVRAIPAVNHLLLCSLAPACSQLISLSGLIK